ncbi:hypothetical protein L1049_021239 [Liquidambar formosana]|uniref:Short-chain dehydrogenase TIC 32, chloroplastic n=1 Tax=Liquidambar formosana TaxID=63359 RepID=A0AAP0SB49_LIQFO
MYRYNRLAAYGQSKLANVLHANELAKHLKEDGVEITANSLHPGSIVTNLFRHHSFVEGLVNTIGKFVLKDVQQGAATTCYVALHPQVKGTSGEYFSDSNLAKASSQAGDVELAKKLWDFSMNCKERMCWLFRKKGPSGFSYSSTAEEVTQGIDGTGLTAIVTGVGTPFTLSEDNIELQFATNHIGHFLLTNLLLDTMKKTARESRREGRIVNVSSEGHRHAYREGIRFDRINDQSGYRGLAAYGQSKLANVLHANELAKRLKEDGVEITANSLHPGAIVTNIFRHNSFVEGLVNMIGKFVLKDVHQGAATTCYVALHPQVKGTSGEYFSDSNLAKASSQAGDVELAKKLWDFSMNCKERMWWLFRKKGPSGFSYSSTAEEVTQGIDGTGLTAIVTGIMATPFMLSKDNIELQFATNHIGHFLLTNLLLDTMKKTARESRREGRIVNVSSEAHRVAYREGIRFDRINDQSGYNRLAAYGQSKLANVLHANELAKHLKEDGVEITANSLHPGSIVTNILRHHSFIEGLVNMIGKFVLKDVHQGAATTCYVALHPQVKGTSGEYFSDSNLAKASSQAGDVELAKKLWDFSMKLVK